MRIMEIYCMPPRNFISKIATSISLLLFIIFGAPAQSIYAQQEEVPELITDRPDQTESSSIVPVGWLQIEVGFAMESETTNGVKTEAITVPASLIRFGVSNNFELRLILEHTSTSMTPTAGEKISESGFNDIAIGGKFQFLQEKGWIPETALNLHLHLPADNNVGSPKVAVPNFSFLFSHTLSDIFSCAYNLGMEWDGESAKGTFIYTGTVGVSITDKIGGYAEIYGDKHYASTSLGAAFDCGLTYLIMPNFQVDAEVGFPMNDNGAPFFVGFGAALRIPR